jgi:sulfite reductase (NADPH) hemoprotein beta-component
MKIDHAAELLARPDDSREYQKGLETFQEGAWDSAQWTAFRVRYGVYGQRQSGNHMIRIKVPGGILKTGWLPVIALGMRKYAGDRAHLTTRQDIQLYDVNLGDTHDLLSHLHAGGVSTREAGGNCVRNVTACQQAGLCPAERVDAGQVAERLAGLWLRRPIAQRMPRKFKIAVSGCAADCAGGWYHDLAFVAVRKDQENGFRVLGGGGLGARPMPGIELFDFVKEEDVAAVIEAVLRVHQHRSDRANKSGARFKFTIRRLNAQEIKEEVWREFEVARQLPQKTMNRLFWKTPSGEKPLQIAGPRAVGADRYALVVRPVNGSLKIAQIEGLYDLAQAQGLAHIRITSTQEVVIEGLAAKDIEPVRLWLKSLQLPEVVEGNELADVMGCLGTSTCPIGVVNASGLVKELAAFEGSDGLKIRASGCHNACAQHHVADIGFHGVTRLVNGRPMPHYQLHLGGDMTRPDGLAVEGPVLPARQVPAAFRHLVDVFKEERLPGETVRGWVERKGETGIERLLHPFASTEGGDDYIDWGEDHPFQGPATGKSDCSAPQISNDHLADLAKDALERMDRALLANLWDLALREGGRAVSWSTQLRLELDQQPKAANLVLPQAERLRSSLRYRPELLDAFEQLEGMRELAFVTGQAAEYRQGLSDWLDLIESLEPIQVSGPLGELEKLAAGL